MYYEKPTRILNDGLLEEQKSKGYPVELCENLIEHFDFEALLPCIWKHFYSWYSADVQIVRLLKKDVLNHNQFLLDLYPHTQNNVFSGA